MRSACFCGACKVRLAPGTYRRRTVQAIYCRLDREKNVCRCATTQQQVRFAVVFVVVAVVSVLLSGAVMLRCMDDMSSVNSCELGRVGRRFEGIMLLTRRRQQQLFCGGCRFVSYAAEGGLRQQMPS